MPEPARHLAEVLVATTWQCNLRCSYCFVDGYGLSETGERMSPESAARTVDVLDAALTDVESICLHLYGGEPLTNLPALSAMVARAGEKPPGRFRFAITTNGVCDSPEVFELLDRGRFQVVLSIDGPAEIHDECRRTRGGAATHAGVMAFLTGLRARTRCWVRGSSVVRSGWSLGQASAYLRTLPVDVIKAQAVRSPLGAPYALSTAEWDRYLDDLEAVGRRVIADLEAGDPPRDDRFSSRVLQLLMGKERDHFCGAGHTTFGITPGGEVLPCVLMNPDKYRLGHIDDEPSVWRGAGRKWRAARPVRSECRDCSALALCGGGCPALLPLCGDGECDITRKNCDIAAAIYERFRAAPEPLLLLAGIR